MNPTTHVLEYKMAELEGAPCKAHGNYDNAATLPNSLAVASGQSAQMHALITFMQAGDNVRYQLPVLLGPEPSCLDRPGPSPGLVPGQAWSLARPGPSPRLGPSLCPISSRACPWSSSSPSPSPSHTLTHPPPHPHPKVCGARSTRSVGRLPNRVAALQQLKEEARGSCS